ncbi:MAG: alpha/beta hydrolase [Rhodoferax sp.]|nr:alpha/beta hydrolase [Rhodoferax sp.]
MPKRVKVLTLPGWQNSGPGHWQTLWEAAYGDERVEQHDWLQPLRGDWIARLEEVVLQQSSPVVLAAHSLGCHLVAAWAAHSRSTEQVIGALLVAPPDVMQPNFPPQLHRWTAPVMQRLPFRAVVVASRTDPFASFEASSDMAALWGAELKDVGPAGHVNAESGWGDWPQGRAWLAALAALPPTPES